MRVLKHTHTLRKVRKTTGDSTTFQCNDPKCSWKQPAVLIEGKEFKCNYCTEVFIFTAAMKRMRFPHCYECTNRKKISASEILEKNTQQNVLANLLGEFNDEN